MNKLTTFAKVCIVVVVLAVAGGALYFTGMFDGLIGSGRAKEEGQVASVDRSGDKGSSDAGTSTPKPTSTTNQPTSTDDKKEPDVPTQPDSSLIRISLDEWVGWKPLIDANGGLVTKPGSINDNKGLNVEYVIINDADQSSSAFIAGHLEGVGYTIPRYAFLYRQFKGNGLDPKYLFNLYTSNGGDGVIAKAEYSSIESLYGSRIGVPRFSEAQALMDWLIDQTSLTPAEKQSMKDNMVMFDSPDDAARAFFADRLDAAATWQPYLFQAQETSGTQLLFNTANATNLIVGGLIFDNDFISANEEALVKLVQGAVEAYDMYLTDMSNIKASMPMFSLESDANIIEMAGDAGLLTADQMVAHMQGPAQSLFADMADVWVARGEDADRGDAEVAFTDRVVNQLERGTGESEAQVVVREVTQEAKATVQEIVTERRDDLQALFTKRADIRFEPNTAIILTESYTDMDAFVSTATLLDGAIILIEGNIADLNDSGVNTDSGVALSEERARAVAKYLQQRGIDPNRFIIVGNGVNRQIAPNTTEEGRVQNRRTDLSFIIIE